MGVTDLEMRDIPWCARMRRIQPDYVHAVESGRFDEAITLTRRAIELDPLRVVAHSNLGLHGYYAGRWQEAEAAFRKTLELNPQYPAAHKNVGSIYLERSRP